MNISFQINCKNFDDFINHWSSKYSYPNECKYENNVGKPLTERSRLELFKWKNGSNISQRKMNSILNNYPLSFTGNEEMRYLNYTKEGGAIWNIFYIHCLKPEKWPIFDQHTFRAMKYMQTGKIIEIGNDKSKYESYTKEYIPFIQNFKSVGARKLDKALFSFGQFLKTAKKYA